MSQSDNAYDSPRTNDLRVRLHSERKTGTLENMSRAPSKSRLANIFIVAVIASQIWLPLSYYLGDDPFDERFAWRMFSPFASHTAKFKRTTTPMASEYPYGYLKKSIMSGLSYSAEHANP